MTSLRWKMLKFISLIKKQNTETLELLQKAIVTDWKIKLLDLELKRRYECSKTQYQAFMKL